MPLDNLEEIRRVLHRSWVSARGHAKKKKLEFSLFPESVIEKLYKQQVGRCAVTGMKFSLEPSLPKALVKHPFAPSIDRRLSDRGYTKDNVRLACVAVNFGMGQWGEETYLTLAREAIRCNENKGIEGESKWHAAVRERLEAAEKLLPLLPEDQQAKQRHRIAGFKAALTSGQLGVKRRVDKAVATIRSNRTR